MESNVLVGFIRVAIAGAAAVALFSQWSDLQSVLDTASIVREPSAIQIVQLYVELFVAPALLTIGLAVAGYIATRWTV